MGKRRRFGEGLKTAHKATSPDPTIFRGRKVCHAGPQEGGTIKYMYQHSTRVYGEHGNILITLSQLHSGEDMVHTFSYVSTHETLFDKIFPLIKF